jgi:hypothetical protein
LIGTGKYDFPGIRKAGAKALASILSATKWGAWILASPLKGLFNIGIEFIAEYMTNKGLIVLNVGAIYANGVFDQKAFDKALDEGLKKVEAGGLTPQQKKAIDDEVMRSARRFLRFGSTGR